MKRHELIHAVVAVGLGARVAVAGNQISSIPLEEPWIRRHVLGRTGAQVNILGLGGVIGHDNAEIL